VSGDPIRGRAEKMLSCPVCGEDIAPLFISVADGSQVLGLSLEEVERLIDQGEVQLRVDISRCRPVPLLDLRTMKSLPSRVHETMTHMNNI